MPAPTPRPPLLAGLKSLGGALDRRLGQLEAQAEGLHLLATGRPGHGAPGSEALVAEARGVGTEVASCLETVVEQRMAMVEFLAGMQQLMAQVERETSVQERFLGQYGWEDGRPYTPASLDWSRPPEEESAVGLSCEEEHGGQEEPEVQENIKSPKSAVRPGTKTIPVASPTIFDIGLSDATMKMLLAKAKPPATRSPSPPPTHSLAGGVQKLLGQPPSPTPPYVRPLLSPSPPSPLQSLRPPTSTASPETPLIQTLYLPKLNTFNDSQTGASPELHLRSALPSLQPPPDLSLTGSSSGEISPGLPRRTATPTISAPAISSNPRTLLDTPELPVLQTMDLRKVVAAARLQATAPSSTTPEEPVLQSRLPKTPVAILRREPVLSDTPEEPVLQTMDLRKLVAGARLQAPAPSSTTPEEPMLQSRPSKTPVAILRKAPVVSATPEEPVLQTIDLRRLVAATRREGVTKTTPEEPVLSHQMSTTTSGRGKENPSSPVMSAPASLKSRPLSRTPETPVLSSVSRRNNV